MMKTTQFLLLLFSVSLFTACGPKPAKVMEAPPSENEEVQKEMEVEPEIMVAKPAFGSAGIKKTACYGSCPVYEVHFYATGYATYKGKSNVKMKGNWRAELSQQQCSDILTNAQKADYFNLSDVYPENGKTIPDLPFTITYVEFGEVKKEIRNNIDAPQELLDFEAYLVELIEKLNWAQTEGQ